MMQETKLNLNHFNTMSLIAESAFFQLFFDGSVIRFTPPTIAPSPNEWSSAPAGSYKSKDITIDPSKSITARIFLPQSSQKIPVVAYFHGGGFCIGSTTWAGYHMFLANLACVAKIIVLSVDYRLAPEHKLPMAYDDCFAALEWLAGPNSEPWLESQADVSQVFLSGDSAGGNIAHHVALKVMAMGVSNKLGICIKGLMSIHPYFGSEPRTELELDEASAREVSMNDMFWRLSLPNNANRDHHWCNFARGEAEWSQFPATVIFVAELDFLRERGEMYAEVLKRNGVREVRLVKTKGEGHVFHVWNPDKEATYALQFQMSSFIHNQ